MEQRDFTVNSFNKYLGEKKLMGSKCKKCGALYLPPRPLCQSCHEASMEIGSVLPGVVKTDVPSLQGNDASKGSGAFSLALAHRWRRSDRYLNNPDNRWRHPTR